MRCSATNKRGQPCGAHALAGGPLCYGHAHPERLRAAGQRGGRVSPTAPPADADPQQLEGVALARWFGSRLVEAFQAVREDRLEAGKAHALASLANAARGMIAVAADLDRLGELEAALEELEAHLGASRR